jgi:GT2 family glycosyltransferase
LAEPSSCRASEEVKEETTVSIIVPNCNGREHLDTCLSSLHDLAFPREQLEIIVVDNCSTDGSVELVRSGFPDVQVIRNEVNLGFSRSANQGVEAAKGEYVAFLNNDMRVDSKWLRVLIDTLQSREGIACVGSTVLSWDGASIDFMGRPDDAFCLAYDSRDEDRSPPHPATSANPTLFASGGAALFRRQVFRELGGFDPDFFLYHEDVDLGWRIWLRGYECLLSSESLVFHRGGATSKRLPPEYIQLLSQSHTLASVFKNLEVQNLRQFLPLLLYCLIVRGRWLAPARSSFATAVRRFQSSLASLLKKRSVVQTTRVRSDDDLFAQLGDPFGFLRRQDWYEAVKDEAAGEFSGLEFDIGDTASVDRAVDEWVNGALFLYESRLTANLESLVEGEGRGSPDLTREIAELKEVTLLRRRELAAKTEAIQDHSEEQEGNETIVQPSPEVAGVEYVTEESRGKQGGPGSSNGDLLTRTAHLRAQLTDKENAVRIISEQLAAKSAELDRITRSLGWRVLARYGKFKYRYLLPVYDLIERISSPVKSPGTTRTATLNRPRPIESEKAAVIPKPVDDLPELVDTSFAPVEPLYDVICFPIIDWCFRFQRPQQLAAQFAKHGHRVFYLKTTFGRSSAEPSVTVLRERINEVELPASSHLNVYRGEINDKTLEVLFSGLEQLRAKTRIEAAVCVVQLPFWAPLAMKARTTWDWKIVYDCIDEHGGFSTNSSAMVKQEQTLVERADLVVATSRALFDKVRRRSRRSLLLPNAGDVDHFSSPRGFRPLGDLAGPVIGYYGAISDWFDVEMVRYAASSRPEWQFVLIGDTHGADVSALQKLDNIHLIGEQPYAALPGYLHRFDVACIPFLLTPLTAATNPVKFYEYLSAGKPVVAVELPDLEAVREYYYPVRSKEEFVVRLEEALREHGDDKRAAGVAFAQSNTWRHRYDELSASIPPLFGKVSIVIVSYVNLEYLKLCLESVWHKTSYPNFDVIVVDNGARPEIVEYLIASAARETRLRLIFNEENQGFARANNVGIRASADSEFVVLLNDDTVVTRGWLGRLVRYLQDERVGLIGPVTSWAGNEARIEVSYEGIEGIDEFAEGYTRAHANRTMELPMLAMFCVGMRRSLLDEIGLIDERFGVGLFEDDDFAHRVRQAGYRILCAEDIFVHHWGRASFSLLDQDKYDRLFDENRRKFEEKWGRAWQPHRARQAGD